MHFSCALEAILEVLVEKYWKKDFIIIIHIYSTSIGSNCVNAKCHFFLNVHDDDELNIKH